MRQLAKGSALLTMVSIGEMLMRFVRTKFIAVLLGPAGTGFLAQLAIFFEALRVWGDLGSRRAVIKQIAEERRNKGESGRYSDVIKTSYTLVLAASAAVALLVVLFSSQISRQIYGDPGHRAFIIFMAFLLPLASLATITASIVKGNLDYRPFAKYTLAAYAVVIIATPAIIYFFRFWGAVLIHGLFFACPFAGYLVFNVKHRFLYLTGRFNFSALKEQFSYGAIEIYHGTLAQFARLIVATWIVRLIGLSEMGLYQVVITFTTVYMSIPIQAMSGYTFPFIAGASSSTEIIKAINDSIRFLMFVLVPIIVSLMTWPEIFIRIFFSGEFLQAAPVLQVQLFGSFFTMLAYSFGVALAAKGKMKSMVTCYTAHPFLFLVFSWLLFGKWGLMGIATAFAIAGFADAALQYSFARHYFKVRLAPKNVRLIFATFAWTAAAFYAGTSPEIWIKIGVLALGIPWFFFCSKDHERRFLFEKIRAWARKYQPCSGGSYAG